MNIAQSVEELELNKTKWDNCRDFLRREVEHIFLMGQQGSAIVTDCKKCHNRDYVILDINPFAIDNIVTLIIEQIKARETAYAICAAWYYLEANEDK